jgi:site-specific DNA-methyltransferase (adenine-specific)
MNFELGMNHGGPSRTGAETQSGNVHFSSETNEWATPQSVFEALDREFGFTLDPCSTDLNCKCENHYTAADNGLMKDWGRHVVFMNPPYGREIGRWMAKALGASRCGATVVCLVPARTDTAWWHNCAVYGEVRFVKGRIKFGDGKCGAPFPSAIVIFYGKSMSLVTSAATRGELNLEMGTARTE